MERTRRGRRLWWLLLAPLVVLGVWWAYRYHSGRAFEPTPFTADGPELAALRQAVKDASVVLVVIDGARADHVGCYGYPRKTTPNIDRLAESSVVFEQHFCQSTETKSSTASLLTSQYWDTHLADGPRALLKGTFTWEGGLEAAGFRTALFSSNLKASPVFGIGDGFQHAECDRDLEPLVQEGEKRVHPEVLVRAFRRWVEGNAGERFFAYLHFMPPHNPYLQPEEMTKLFEGLEPVNFKPGGFEFPERVQPPRPILPPLPEWINLYDANLRYGDWAIAEVERLLRELGLFDNTLLIVTADHGEGFGEHGYVWHGSGVYDDVTHIPLLIRFPGDRMAGRRIGTLTQTVDLLPTIFDLLKVRYPRQWIQGRSLLPLVAGVTGKVHDYTFSRAGGRPTKYLVRSQSYALILYGNGEWRALYDLETDPGQRVNIIADREEVAEEMVKVFRRFAEMQRRPPVDFLDPKAKLPPLPRVREMELSPEQERQLRNLGYLR